MVMMILMTHLMKLSGSNVRSSTQHAAHSRWCMVSRRSMQVAGIVRATARPQHQSGAVVFCLGWSILMTPVTMLSSHDMISSIPHAAAQGDRQQPQPAAAYRFQEAKSMWKPQHMSLSVHGCNIKRSRQGCSVR